MRRGLILGFVVCAIICVGPTVAGAQTPEGILKMCLRDGRNMVNRLKRNISHGASSYRSFERTCIAGPKAGKIKGMPEYQQVLGFHAEGKALIEAATKKVQAAKEEASSSALAAGPGGDSNAVRARWKARPERCRSSEAWNKAAGHGRARQGSARIVGAGDQGDSQGVHQRVFQGRGSDLRWPSGFRAEDHLTRIICGVKVEGVDPWFSERSDIYGKQFLRGDSRVVLSEAVVNGRGSAAQGVLYKVALLQECFRGTQWRVPESYAAYALCRDAVHQPPSESAVIKALETVFPGRAYERANVLYLLREGLKSMKEVDAAFGRLEAKYPRMKQVYRDAADKARQRHAQRRSRHAAIYRTLDPRTQRLQDDLDSAHSSGCEQELLRLRRELGKELKAKDEAGVKRLRVLDPLGFQITEALAHCYLGRKKLAHAYAEASALKKQNRRLTLSEEIFFSRLDAFVALEQQLKSKGRIQQVLPNYSGFWTGMPRPETVYLPRQMLSKLEGLGKYKIVGEAEKAPAIVSAMKPVSGGVKLVFKKHNFIHRYRQISCRTTNRVERYEISGSSIRPIYQQDCRHVGPVLKKKLTFQEAPVVLAKAEAALVKQGMQLIALDNIHAAGDAVLVDLWWPKQGRARALILQGVHLK